ncbi:MAG: Hpt domain-containing protein [Bacteroidetes bacterium SW_9_63_38]|nr:MAG: Hpt domain-containing protein [Bacteroidetes bacterium SW_9_63_38]
MSDSPLNEDALLALVDGDSEFLGSLVDTFLRDCSSYLNDIRTAVEEDDADALQQEAHGLKGAAANMQADAAQAAARRLEDIGRTGDLARAPDALAQLEEEVERLEPALKALVDDA